MRAGAVAAGLMLLGWAATTFAADVRLYPNQPITGISGAGVGSMQYFYIDVPDGATDLVITTSGPAEAGDVDLYVRYDQKPMPEEWDCRPYVAGNDEQCSFPWPAAGRWWVGLRVYFDYYGVSLRATFSTRSRWANAAPTINGSLGATEWNGAGMFLMQHGAVYFLNDSSYLYVLLDVAADTVNQPVFNGTTGDGWAISWDANENGGGDVGTDRLHASCQDGTVLTKGTLSALPCSFDLCQVSIGTGAKGFGSTPLSATAHTFWELRLPLSEVGAAPGELARFGVAMYSTSPYINEFVPSNPCDWSSHNALKLAYAPDNPRLMWATEGTYAMVWTVTEGGAFVTMQGFGMEGWWASCYQRREYSVPEMRPAELLWSKPGTGEAQVWTITPAGTFGGMQGFGLAPGWYAMSYQRHGDGSAELLWANPTTGVAQVWTITAGGTFGGVQGFGLAAGWWATSYQRHDDGSAHLLWANGPAGVAQLWSLTPGGGWGGMQGFGLAPGWLAMSYQRKNDLTARMVWSTSVTGQTQVWTLTAGGGWGGMHGFGYGGGWFTPCYWVED